MYVGRYVCEKKLTKPILCVHRNIILITSRIHCIFLTKYTIWPNMQTAISHLIYATIHFTPFVFEVFFIEYNLFTTSFYSKILQTIQSYNFLTKQIQKYTDIHLFICTYSEWKVCAQIHTSMEKNNLLTPQFPQKSQEE